MGKIHCITLMEEKLSERSGNKTFQSVCWIISNDFERYLFTGKL